MRNGLPPVRRFHDTDTRPMDETSAPDARAAVPDAHAAGPDADPTGAHDLGRGAPARDLPRGARLPRARLSATLAAVMLGIGVAVGAAVGPGPESSSAAGTLAAQLPALVASLAVREHAQQEAAAAAAQAVQAAATPPAITSTPTPAPATPAAAPAPATPASGTETAAGEAESRSSSPSGGGKKLPSVTNVWLIELAGPTFSAALSQASAAPYIDGQAIASGTLLSGWSALSASAFAGEAALLEPPSTGSPPPLLHSIVQPPCPEGAAGASCAPESPGELTAADTFLKETLATITATPAYREHGLVVVTFATVAQPTLAGLAAGSSSATLTSEPPAGALLISPFARAGARPSTAFDPSSPRKSVEALLH